MKGVGIISRDIAITCLLFVVLVIWAFKFVYNSQCDEVAEVLWMRKICKITIYAFVRREVVI